MKHNSATTIKCKFSNVVHKILEPNLNIKKSERLENKKDFTNMEKIELFDKILSVHNECSAELSTCLYKRREKKRTQKARMVRGYIPKKKTTKEQHENFLQTHYI